MAQLSWTQPICERCWIEAEGEWELERTGDGARQVLARLRFPIRLKESTLERCSWCGLPTILGAYKRADPRAVPYPAEESE